jgi:hypothetical protein
MIQFLCFSLAEQSEGLSSLRRDVRFRTSKAGSNCVRSALMEILMLTNPSYFVPRSFSQEELTAYHEAGHALAFSLIGREVVQVFLGPEPGNGGCMLTPVERAFDLYDPKARALAEKHIVAHLAGPVAEALLLDRVEDCGGLTFSASDLQEARLIIEKLTLVRRGYGAQGSNEWFFWSKWLAAAELLGDPLHWRTVEALARILLVQRCIEGQHARQLMAAALKGPMKKL